MAGIILAGIFVVVLAIIWAVLRFDNKIGPLAAAQQRHEIQSFEVQSVLAAKETEAKIALAEARIIDAQAKVMDARAHAMDLERRALS